MRYEEKYRFIDVGKMHEKTKQLESQLKETSTRSKLLEKELFDIRERIMRFTHQSISDQEKEDLISGISHEERTRHKENKKNQDWKASEELEQAMSYLIGYINTEADVKLPKGHNLTQWSNKTHYSKK